MTKKTRYFMAGSAAVLTVGLCTGLVAFYTGGFQTVSASPISSEMRYVPADASLVAYADVRAIMDSELRQRLKAVLPADEQGQKEFQEQTGIDIEHDIDYVVAAASPTQGNPRPLAVLRGRFNDTQLETLAREHGGSVEDYKGKRLVVVANGDRQMVLAFLEPGLIGVGEATAVKNAIDAQLTAHSITSNDEMMNLVADMSSNSNAWAVGRFDLITANANLPQEITSRLPAIKWFAASGHINGGLSGTLRAEARDEEAAENLKKVINGVIALGQLQAQADPSTAALIQSLQISGSGKTVALSFTVPSQIFDMIPKMHDEIAK